MNILFLALDVDLAIPKGDSIHVTELTKALAARGHRMSVIAASPPATHDRDRETGTRYYSCTVRSNSAVLRFCLEIARQTRPDVIYERRLSPKISFVLSRLVGVPFFVEINGIEQEASMLATPRHHAFRSIRLFLRARMFWRASGIVAVTPQLSDYIARSYRIGQMRIATVANGVDPHTFLPRDRDEARNFLGLPHCPILLFVGNLVPWQGLETLLHAIPAILENQPGALLVIVGDGVMRSRLESLAANLGVLPRIVFAGMVPHDVVPLYIGASDVCVAPFTIERNQMIGLSPLKLYEYMACSRPVVASDLPGIGGLLRSSASGIPVTPDDPKSLGIALNELLNDPEQATKMGARGREFVLKEQTWSRVAERIEPLLSRTVTA